LALILINIAFTLPFAVWMSIGSYENIPADLEEAAYIDGCSLMGAYWKVVFPVSKIGLISVALYTFIISWAEFIFSLVIIESPEKMTVALKLGSMVSEMTVHWNEISAATVVVSLPLLAFFMWAQKYFIRGMVAGAVKE
jgi:ABC-type glycerol-3-phosphate transport system permease component